MLCVYIPRIITRPIGMSLTRTAWVKLNRLHTAYWLRALRFVHAQMGSRCVSVALLVNKLQTTLFQHAPHIGHLDEQWALQFWMMKQGAGSTPSLPASDLGNTASWDSERINLGPSPFLASDLDYRYPAIRQRRRALCFLFCSYAYKLFSVNNHTSIATELFCFG